MSRVSGLTRCRFRHFVKIQSTLKQSLDFGLPEPAVAAGCAYAAYASSRCPPGHRLRVYPEQRGHFAGR